MTSLVATPAPLHRPEIRFGVPAQPANRRVSGLFLGKLLLAVALACLTSAALDAAEWVQSWVPQELRMPEDAEVLSSREIGSTVRMFSIATGEDPDALFAEWEEALRNGGYSIDQALDEGLEHAIEFSGATISNAKIAAAPNIEDGRTVLEFDATLP